MNLQQPSLPPEISAKTSRFDRANAHIVPRVKLLRAAYLSGLSRTGWGAGLGAAAVVALGLSYLMGSFSIGSALNRTLVFTFTVVCIKFGLFALWPQLSRRGTFAKSILREVFLPAPQAPNHSVSGAQVMPIGGELGNSLALWNEQDPRLDLALFSANVPTFVLNQDQRLLDWNPAFELVFGHSPSIKRGVHVSAWYALLDNFRRVPKRTDKLYGEGILPITDRERATYISAEFGRMVFSKIMSPLIDRRTGKILGWCVVLNINSVNQREEFFTKLYAQVAGEAKRIRFAAAYDSVYAGYAPRQELQQRMVEALHHVAPGGRLLDLACGTGPLTPRLLAEGFRVTAVDGDAHLLRRLRDNCTDLAAHGKVSTLPKLVRRAPGELRGLPESRFDACVIFQLHKNPDPASVLAAAFHTLKAGAVLVVAATLNSGNIADHFAAVRHQLEVDGCYEELKHQFTHVCAWEEVLVQLGQRPTREDLRAQLLEAGFMLDGEAAQLEEGHTLMLVAHKP